ncbi:hypothetical protein HFN78_24760 [Rhizobium laguerreae]|uniref:hypothetical protein n=1 Tax=Rhizobium laguerreae TaxID=1076926 RepID=UPI001C91D7FE|nr:hypothetical protein [Rhizobium laguerreae]MBY3474094.1 hypothetical protein [Rhizobium laguerreae]MBY3521888.1 hypothetical protein [Rhizobium laguerreae]
MTSMIIQINVDAMLAESADRIHLHIKKTVESVLSIGRELLAVKEVIPHYDSQL